MLSSDRQLIKIYLKLTDDEINYCLSNKNNRVSNRTRTDLNPSLGLFTVVQSNRTKIHIKDFAIIGFEGDIFDIVGYLLKLNSKKTEDFKKICNHIGQSILSNNTDINYIPVKKTDIVPKKIYIKPNNNKLEFEAKQWDANDVKYWFNIIQDKAIFKHFTTLVKLEFIYVAKTILYNDKVIYNYKKNDIAYIYYFDTNILGEIICKAYFPNRIKSSKVTRFITNDKELVRGLKTNSLDYDKAIITKSSKDAILMRLHTIYSSSHHRDFETRINIYFIQGESNVISKQDFNLKFAQYQKIYILFDYDRAGIEAAYYYSLLHPKVEVLFIKNSKFIPLGMNEIISICTVINNRLLLDVKPSMLIAFINNFTYKKYFAGIKDFADLVQQKGFKHILKITQKLKI